MVFKISKQIIKYLLFKKIQHNCSTYTNLVLNLNNFKQS